MDEIARDLLAICDTLTDPHVLRDIAKRCAERSRRIYIARLKPRMRVCFRDSRDILRIGNITKIIGMTVNIQAEGVEWTVSPQFVEPYVAPKGGAGHPPR